MHRNQVEEKANCRLFPEAHFKIYLAQLNVLTMQGHRASWKSLNITTELTLRRLGIGP